MVEEKIFELLEKMYIDFSKKFEKIDERFEKIDDRFESIEKKLDQKADKQDIARLEFQLKADINALYDGYKLTYEKTCVIEKKVEILSEKVDKHELEIKARQKAV